MPPPELQAIAMNQTYTLILTRDSDFIAFNAGYRSSIDGTTASCALLPWEKHWMQSQSHRR
jgi:hypothetical protein